MLAAKEKTFEPSSGPSLTWSSRGHYVQQAATSSVSTPRRVVKTTSRYDGNDACKISKPHYGLKEKFGPVVPLGLFISPAKTLGKNDLGASKSHRVRGLMYFRARFYDPSTGEFISRDPLEYVDGMSHYRAYFVPSGVDPSGSSTIVCTPWASGGARSAWRWGFTKSFAGFCQYTARRVQRRTRSCQYQQWFPDISSIPGCDYLDGSPIPIGNAWTEVKWARQIKTAQCASVTARCSGSQPAVILPSGKLASLPTACAR